jgi:phosphoenolpyruvate carboxylase
MGSLLGCIIQDHPGAANFEKIEEMHGLAKQWREAGVVRNVDTKDEAGTSFDALANLCSKLSNEELHIMARAFTRFLAIANAAEGHHRGHLLAMAENDANELSNKSDSCGGVLQNLMEQLCKGLG